MKHANLGDGLEVSSIGLGAMGMSAYYGPTDESEAVATLRRAVALMAGADAGALPMPAQRPDPVGGLLAEHLRSLWEMIPVTGSAR